MSFTQTPSNWNGIWPACPALTDVTSDMQIRSPQINVNIDRDKAAAMQMNRRADGKRSYDAYGPRWVSTIYSNVNEYKVMLELLPQYQSDPHALSMLYFKSPGGKLIPLNTLANISEETGPQAINHAGQLPAATVSFNIAARPRSRRGRGYGPRNRRPRPAIHHRRIVPGNGEGVPGLAHAISGCCCSSR